jgi:uncharacterized protein (TIGR02646 family)
MHWVNRGLEPSGLKQIRNAYTIRWVKYYRNNTAKKPNDKLWQKFHPIVSKRFSSLCAFCEAETKGEVDHFRPKARFPELVYSWSNWILACHDCNNPKNVFWPRFGFVNPCAEKQNERPEIHFQFDLVTGEMLPNASLNPQCKRRALDTIGKLKLNGFHQLKRRTKWIVAFTFAIDEGIQNPNKLRPFLKTMTSRKTALSSLSRAILKQRGLSFARL